MRNLSVQEMQFISGGMGSLDVSSMPYMLGNAALMGGSGLFGAINGCATGAVLGFGITASITAASGWLYGDDSCASAQSMINFMGTMYGGFLGGCVGASWMLRPYVY